MDYHSFQFHHECFSSAPLILPAPFVRSLLNLLNRFSLCRVRSLLQRTTASWSCYSRFSGHERELVWKSDTLGGFIQRLLVLAIVTVLVRVIQGRSVL